MTAVLAISEALISTARDADGAGVLDLIATSACRLVGLQRSGFFTYDPVTDSLQGIAAYGVDADSVRAIHEPLRNMPLAEQAIRHRSPVLSEDAPADNALPERYILQFGVRSLGCVPLIAKEQVLGVIFVDQGGRPFCFSHHQQQLLQAFGNLAAVALEHARLAAVAKEAAILQDHARIAQELHDRVAQTFFSIGLVTKSLLETAPAASIRQQLSQIQQLATQGGIEIRNAIFALSSPPEHKGLRPGLAHLIREHRATTGNSAELVIDDELPPLSAAVEQLLYSAAREALCNVRKHAHATTVLLSLSCEDGWVSLAVRDNGQGVAEQIEPASRFGLGFGLCSLRTRLEAYGGTCLATNNDDRGVTITCRLPYTGAVVGECQRSRPGTDA